MWAGVQQFEDLFAGDDPFARRHRGGQIIEQYRLRD
jgi:hypothetical protein